MPEEPELACKEKLRFATQKEAQAAVIVAEHQRGTKLKIYLCRNCGWWHLSSR